MFASYTSNLSRSLSSLQQPPSSISPPPPNESIDLSRLARMDDTLKKYEAHFNRHLRILVDSLNYYAATETVVLLGLCARLTAAEEGAGGKEREGAGLGFDEESCGVRGRRIS